MINVHPNPERPLQHIYFLSLVKSDWHQEADYSCKGQGEPRESRFFPLQDSKSIHSYLTRLKPLIFVALLGKRFQASCWGHSQWMNKCASFKIVLQSQISTKTFRTRRSVYPHSTGDPSRTSIQQSGLPIIGSKWRASGVNSGRTQEWKVCAFARGLQMVMMWENVWFSPSREKRVIYCQSDEIERKQLPEHIMGPHHIQMQCDCSFSV